MSATRDEVMRLAFSKYLLSLASRHIGQPEPLSSVGLLLMHDAVEHLLVLCCYCVGADPKKSDFLGYWKMVEDSGRSLMLPDKGRMGAFNDARVSLKHRGIQPARAQLEEFQRLVLGFFETVVPLVFDVSFASINLTALVTNANARTWLEAATAALDEGRFEEAATAAAYAFDDVRKSSALHRYFGNKQMPEAPYIRRNEDEMDYEARRYFETVSAAIESLHESVSLLSLGIDISRFKRFQASTPAITDLFDGGRKHVARRRQEATPRTRENVEFCINFVIDCAFRIQEHPEIPR